MPNVYDNTQIKFRTGSFDTSTNPSSIDSGNKADIGSIIFATKTSGTTTEGRFYFKDNSDHYFNIGESLDKLHVYGNSFIEGSSTVNGTSSFEDTATFDGKEDEGVTNAIQVVNQGSIRLYAGNQPGYDSPTISLNGYNGNIDTDGNITATDSDNGVLKVRQIGSNTQGSTNYPTIYADSITFKDESYLKSVYDDIDDVWDSYLHSSNTLNISSHKTSITSHSSDNDAQVKISSDQCVIEGHTISIKKDDNTYDSPVYMLREGLWKTAYVSPGYIQGEFLFSPSSNWEDKWLSGLIEFRIEEQYHGTVVGFCSFDELSYQSLGVHSVIGDYIIYHPYETIEEPYYYPYIYRDHDGSTPTIKYRYVYYYHTT